MKKFCLFAFLVVAALGHAWGLVNNTSVKFDFSDKSELSRFTGLWGWEIGVVPGGEAAVREDWESGAFFENRSEPNFFNDEKITYNNEKNEFEYAPLKYYSNNSGALHVFALVKLPEGVVPSDVPGALIKQYVVAGPWIGGKPAETAYKIKWGVADDPETCWRNVTLLSAQQRYPWNNIVDYKYALRLLEPGGAYKLAVEVAVNEKTMGVTNQLTTVADGTYTGSVDLSGLGEIRKGRAKMTLKVIK